MENLNNDDARMKTLHSASLVCRDWFPFTRPYIFQAITLSENTFIGFLLALGRSPSIAQHVRFLTLKTDDPLKTGGIVGWPECQGSIGLVFERFINVQDLTLDFAHQATLPPSQLPALTKLTILQWIPFASFGQLLEFVRMHQGLHTLRLMTQTPSAHYLPVERSIARPPPPLLQSIRLEVHITPLLDWLMTHKISGIHTLHLDDVHEEQQRTVGRFLHFLGPSLTTLSFSPCPQLPSPETLSNRIDLTFNTNLHSISFPRLFVDNSYLNLPVHWVPTLLSQATSLPITRVHFVLCATDTATKLCTLPWTLVDDILERMTHLEHVYLYLKKRLWRHDLTVWFTDQLVSCNQRGLLVFSHTSD